MFGLNQITEAIIGAAMTVHRRLGPGLLESAYEVCLAYEWRKIGLNVDQQKPVPLVYEEIKLDCGYRLDLLVESQVIVEVKSKEALHPVDAAQLLSYLRLLNLQVGLLINFHVPGLKDGLKRIFNNYREWSLCVLCDFSASLRLKSDRVETQRRRGIAEIR